MTIALQIDGEPVEVEAGATVLDAARAAERYVPTLCFDERLAPFGACRVCMVGLEGADAPVAACTTPCTEGMRVETAEATARRIATATVELVLSELSQPPAEHTELAAVARLLGVGEPRWSGDRRRAAPDRRHPYLVLDPGLCISCGRCIRACDEVQGAFALTATGRGFTSSVAAGLDSGFEDSTCVSCGACADSCPTDAITEHGLLELAESMTEQG